MKRNLLSLCILFGCLMNAQTYSNGNLSTGTTATASNTPAPAGYTWSELQGTNTTLGSTGSGGGTNDYRLTDDFTVPANESWSVSSVQVFCYQTGSITLPVNNLTVRIFNGIPDATTSTLVAGSATTNIFDAAGTTDGLMYRTGNTTAGTTRKIWKVKGNMTATLNSGTYWLDYQVIANNAGFVYFPPVTNPGVVSEPGANARQGTAGVYAALSDTGSGNAQAMPFIINYAVLGTSETRQLDTRVVVYPNPTVDSFKLMLPPESMGAKTQIGIFDMSGKQLKNFKISESYDVKDLPKGVYLLKINDGKNIKATKLIKN